MRLVLVHGINNEGGSEQGIIDAWLAALALALPPTDLATIRRTEIIAPYYGDALFAAAQRQSRAGPQPVAQSAAAAPGDEAEFYREALEDIAPAAGVTETHVRAEAGAGGAIELGLADDRRLLALLRALEHVAPFQAPRILRFLPQAFVYLNRADVTAEIDGIVGPAIAERPCVIVAHSLGSVITFKLLRETAARVPFYLTVGSPLGVKAVQNALGPVFARPDCVSSWLNGLDRDDAVTIGRALKDTTFGPGIENVDDIDNGDQEPHAVRMYLRDRRIAEALARAMSS